MSTLSLNLIPQHTMVIASCGRLIGLVLYEHNSEQLRIRSSLDEQEADYFIPKQWIQEIHEKHVLLNKSEKDIKAQWQQVDSETQ